MMENSVRSIVGSLVAISFSLTSCAQEIEKKADSQVGLSFEVPYLLTQTNHFVVRALINGKGPFHLVVDTGAPGLYLSTEASKIAGVKSETGKYFSNLRELRLEGGPTLTDLKIRVEDPFQLVGMNALGLPGIKLDGLMGYSVLARYRITLDPTHHRMMWTKLDFDPKESADDVPAIRREEIPLQLQAMEMLGPAMKFASIFIGKQPETKRVPQGFAGFSVRALEMKDSSVISVESVWPESPASSAGIRPNDIIDSCDGTVIKDLSQFTEIMMKKPAGSTLRLSLKRGSEEIATEILLQENF